MVMASPRSLTCFGLLLLLQYHHVQLMEMDNEYDEEHDFSQKPKYVQRPQGYYQQYWGPTVAPRQNNRQPYWQWNRPTSTQQPFWRPTQTYTTRPTPALNCGVGRVQTFTSRIIGGVNATKGELPWQAALLGSDSTFCGAVIIGPSHVLTAAHCVSTSYTGVTYTLGYGSIDRETALNNGRTHIGAISSSNIKIHRDFNGNLDNDIALITLPRPLTLSSVTSPACLPAQNEDPLYEFTNCIVSGWGTIASGVLMATETLKKVSVTLVSDQVCANSYPDKTIGNLRVCAGDILHGGKDSCQGDSGGPLVCLKGGRYYLHGLVSSGWGCGLADYPGLYTQVSSYVSWIKANM